jgi:predicted MPP superfamily phosphohydrolase
MQIAQSADVLLLCGDLVDYRLPEEAIVLAKEVSNLKIPVLAVLGNHEFESGKPEQVKRIFRMPVS